MIKDLVKSYNEPDLEVLEIDTGTSDFVKFFNKLHKTSNKQSKILLTSIKSSWKPIIYLAKKNRINYS